MKTLPEELKEEGSDCEAVDLRNNGGGSLGEANQLVGLFIDIETPFRSDTHIKTVSRDPLGIMTLR